MEFYCQASLHAQGLRTLKVVQAQKEIAEAAEKKFLKAVATLRTEHKYSWEAIEGLQMHLQEEQRCIYLEWGRFSRYALEGLAHDKSAHEVFFLAVCGLADSRPLPQGSGARSSHEVAQPFGLASGLGSSTEPASKKLKVLQEHPSEPDEVVADQSILVLMSLYKRLGLFVLAFQCLVNFSSVC